MASLTENASLFDKTLTDIMLYMNHAYKPQLSITVTGSYSNHTQSDSHQGIVNRFSIGTGIKTTSLLADESVVLRLVARA